MQRIAIIGMVGVFFVLAGVQPALAEEGLTPSAPQNPTFSSTNAVGALLRWDPPLNPGAAPIDGYRVYRSSDGIVFVTIGAVSATQFSFQDFSGQVGARVFYYITGTNAYGEGEASITLSKPGFYSCSVVWVNPGDPNPNVRPECIPAMAYLVDS